MPVKKKATLATALKEATAPAQAPLSGAHAPGPPAPVTSKAPSRVGKKTVAGAFDPVVSRQLKQLALEEDTSLQELLREALNDLFRKRGKAPVA